MIDIQTAAKKMSATGILKKLCLIRKEPRGFLRVLTPIESRGLEVEFIIANLLIPPKEHGFLVPGMTMKFRIAGDNIHGPLRALDIRPLEVAEYTGSVIKVPKESSDEGLTVSLDLTLDSVQVTAESYASLKTQQPILPGDQCLLRISWRTWVSALMNRYQPKWELVSLIEPAKPSRPRSLSRTRLSKSALTDLSSTTAEDLSPQCNTTSDQRKPRAPRCSNLARESNGGTPIVVKRSRARSLTAPRRSAPLFVQQQAPQDGEDHPDSAWYGRSAALPPPPHYLAPFSLTPAAQPASVPYFHPIGPFTSPTSAYPSPYPGAIYPTEPQTGFVSTTNVVHPQFVHPPWLRSPTPTVVPISGHPDPSGMVREQVMVGNGPGHFECKLGLCPDFFY